MAIAPIPRSDLEAMNAAFKLPDIPHIAERIAEARKLAQEHPDAEQGFIVDAKTGDVVWRGTDGDRETVDIGDAYRKGLAQGNLIVHTHPMPAELSEPDLICAAACESLGNMAVCADGTVSWSTGANKHQCSPQMMDRAALLARHLSGWTEDNNSSVQIARDNYWIAYALRRVGFVPGYWTHYSDSLIDTMSDRRQ